MSGFIGVFFAATPDRGWDFSAAGEFGTVRRVGWSCVAGGGVVHPEASNTPVAQVAAALVSRTASS